MKKILAVTGGAGFVGSNLIEFFLKKTNLNIISIDNYSTGKKNNQINNPRVSYIKGNTKDINRILIRFLKNSVLAVVGKSKRIKNRFPGFSAISLNQKGSQI